MSVQFMVAQAASPFKLLQTTVISGAASNIISFTGLGMSTYRKFMLEFSLLQSDAVNTNYSIFLNNDSTAADYNTETLVGLDAAASAANAANAIINGAAAIPQNGVLTASADIGINAASYANHKGIATMNPAGGTRKNVVFATVKTNATASDISQIDISSSTANGIGIGSYATLYALSK